MQEEINNDRILKYFTVLLHRQQAFTEKNVDNCLPNLMILHMPKTLRRQAGRLSVNEVPPSIVY